MASMRQWAGQTSIAYGAPMIAPSATAFELMPISYMPPAMSLYLATISFRSAISPCAYQYVRLALLSSGGWPAATAADSLANCSGEPGMDCHSTCTPFCLPQSTNVLPTASSVIVFQFAENQTLNVPAAGLDAAAAGAVAAATVVGAGAAPTGGVVGLAPAAGGGAAGLPLDCGLLQAARARPTTEALYTRNFRRENVLRGSGSTPESSP